MVKNTQSADAITDALLYVAARGARGRMHVYLSGPISGYPDLNRAGFTAAHQALNAAGFSVINPLELSSSTDWNLCMRVDLAVLMVCDAVATLDGWRHSRGSCMEVQLARRLDIPVRPWWAWCDEENALAQSFQADGTIDADGWDGEAE